MPRAQSADGVMHDFPEGTDSAVIDRVMKAYATQHASPSASPRTSGLSSYVSESLDALKGAGKDIVEGAKDIGRGLIPGQDPRPGFERLKEIGMFASGGLTSPIGPQRSGPLARADRAKMGNPPPPKSVTVEDFLKKAGEKKGGDKDEAASMSTMDWFHLIHGVLRHDPIALLRLLGKQ